MLKAELQDHKKDKKQLMKDKIEVMQERDGLQMVKKKTEIAIAELSWRNSQGQAERIEKRCLEGGG